METMLCIIFKLFIQWIKLPNKNWPAVIFWYTKNNSLVPTIFQAMHLKRHIKPPQLTSNALYASCLEQILGFNLAYYLCCYQRHGQKSHLHTFTGHEFTCFLCCWKTLTLIQVQSEQRIFSTFTASLSGFLFKAIKTI